MRDSERDYILASFTCKTPRKIAYFVALLRRCMYKRQREFSGLLDLLRRFMYERQRAFADMHVHTTTQMHVHLQSL